MRKIYIDVKNWSIIVTIHISCHIIKRKKKKDLKDSFEKADTFQEPIETANILEDPLDIPTETEIKGELRDKMVNSLVDVILTIFENREKRFLQWATLHINRKEYHEAVKYIAQGYLYCNKSKKGNQFSEKIYDLMINLTESS